MEFKDMEELLLSMKDDTEFFIGHERAGNKKFNFERPTTGREREIRWHYNSNILFAAMLEKMMDYEKEKKLFVKRRNDFEDYMKELAEKEKQVHEKEVQLGLERNQLYDQIEQIKESISTLTKASELCTAGCGSLKDIVLDGMAGLIQEIDEIKGKKEPQIKFIQDKEPTLRLRLPNFAAEDHDRPLFYLKELKDYLRVNKIKDEDVMTIISQTLSKKAKSWFVSLKNVKSFEEFEDVFRQRYWNEPTKHGLKNFVEMGKWIKGSGTRVDHAEGVITTIRELEMEISEPDMITKIARHFDNVTALAFRMQNINDTGKLYDFLTELDRIDASTNSNQQKATHDENIYKKQFYKQKFKFGDEKNSKNSNNQPTSQGNSQVSQNQNSSQNLQNPNNLQNSQNQNNGNFYQHRGAVPKNNYQPRNNFTNNGNNQNSQKNFGNQNNPNNQNYGNQSSNGQNYQNKPFRRPNNNNSNENQINSLQMKGYFDKILQNLGNLQQKSPEDPTNSGNE